MFEHSEQDSPISDGVTVIWINIHLAWEITWQHDTLESRRHHEWPPLTMTIKELGRVLPHPSACLTRDNLDEHPWVAHTLSQCTSIKWGKVSSNSVTVDATKFAGPHKSYMHQYIINAGSSGPNQCGPELTHVGATTFGALNIKTGHSHPSHPVFSTFPLVALPIFKFCHKPKSITINHIGPPSIERALSWGVFQPLVFYR
jgi:hypothetical protein